MLKITKGLKKKKKGKKSKHKEDDLFTPEELEAYKKRQQQQQQQEQTVAVESCSEKPAAASGENEEWKKFAALTSGVDDILQKTQGDLDRIKSTSFFQRVPLASEVKKQEEARQAEEKAVEEARIEEREREERIKAETYAGIVEVSESETEDEDEDDIFDTAYIDALAAGDVKLAYIPESPTEEEGDDPFDTSYAEKAILGPNAERKGKKLVPLGSAVAILTGQVQAPTCASIKRPSPRRQILKERDLLLGSFDDNANSVQLDGLPDFIPEHKPNLLDDDAPPGEPIDLSKSFIQAVAPVVQSQQAAPALNNFSEFDGIHTLQSPIDDDDEFAQLAAESLSKAPVPVFNSIPQEIVPEPSKESWNAFGEQKDNLDDDNFEDDPFDTTFAENILPGQAELKQIEKEILNSDNDFDFNPRAEETYSELIRTKVRIQLINPSGERESVSSIDRISEAELTQLRPIHRDLLGGSSTDLTQLGEQPLQPNDIDDDDYIEYSDPFDTSIVASATLPGQTELKFLERELLGDIKQDSNDDFDDFDPRAGEPTKQEIYNAIQHRKVSFDLPLGARPDLLSLIEEDSKSSKPLTPYYVRNNSIPEEDSSNIDPFDTSFVSNSAPGREELKLIENELFHSEIRNSISDSDFNPRDDTQVAIAKVVQVIQEIQVPVKSAELPFEGEVPIDLLGVDNFSNAKVLTPAAKVVFEDTYIDPFDTSIACNILPGKTELKLLESELIHSDIHNTNFALARNLTDPDFDPRIEAPKIDLLDTRHSSGVKALTPIHFDIGGDFDEDIDPFDTSIANNIAPGPSELKLLESELI